MRPGAVGCILTLLVVAAAMLAGCGSSTQSPEEDLDHDGLLDAEESAGWNITVDFMGHRAAFHVTSDPALGDTDGDGLADRYEYALNMDPRVRDTDADGLSDCQEVQHTVRSECEDPAFAGTLDGGYHTDGFRADSDAAGSRYVNAHPFLDPTGTLTRPIVWGDGLPDGQEVAGYTLVLPGGFSRLVMTDPRDSDSDHDGLEDGEEALSYHTDPLNPDSDGDGCKDGVDPVPTQAERFILGVKGFEYDGTSSAILSLHVILANAQFTVPSSGGIQVGPGHNDLSGVQQASQRPQGCSFPTYAPWVNVDLYATRDDAQGGPQGLDLTSGNPGGARVAYWNMQTGQVAWDASGAGATSGPLVWRGAAGSLEFQPTLLQPSTQGT